jgi:uncharacterized protein (DUF2336 family)
MSLAPHSSEPYKQRARDADPAVRAAVAADPAAPPELLYYLASDGAEAVRVAAAGNVATPIQSAPAQVKDDSRMVRAALARKLARVLPQLGEGASRTMALSTIEALCSDVEIEVRLALAVTLQDTAFLPAKLALQLAEDAERAVASPVLRFCLSLSDEDLVGLITRARREWIPVEIAQRRSLSNTVATAVWESGNTEAATLLLANAQAQTAPAILDAAVEEAPVVTSFQAPLVRHPALQPAQMERLAAFVDGELLGVLDERARLSRGELSDVSTIVRRRIDWANWRKQGGTGSVRAKALFERGQLDDSAVADAIAWGERDFVTTALALLAKAEEALVAKVLEHQSPKGITALCWKAGISMRTCRQVQIRIARVPLVKALYARGGFDYPLPAEDIKWQLEFYGILPG